MLLFVKSFARISEFKSVYDMRTHQAYHACRSAEMFASYDGPPENLRDVECLTWRGHVRSAIASKSSSKGKSRTQCKCQSKSKSSSSSSSNTNSYSRRCLNGDSTTSSISNITSTSLVGVVLPCASGIGPAEWRFTLCADLLV